MVSKNTLLLQNDYRPYYLYRQKGTLQNLENTGFTKPGFAGLYNIYIMEELHTIFLPARAGLPSSSSLAATVSSAFLTINTRPSTLPVLIRYSNAKRG